MISFSKDTVLSALKNQLIYSTIGLCPILTDIALSGLVGLVLLVLKGRNQIARYEVPGKLVKRMELLAGFLTKMMTKVVERWNADSTSMKTQHDADKADSKLRISLIENFNRKYCKVLKTKNGSIFFSLYSILSILTTLSKNLNYLCKFL